MQQLNYSKDQACLELQDLINNWLSEKNNRNVSALARGAGVSENCIRRILNSNAMPITANLHKIIAFLKPNSTNLDMRNSLDSELSKHLSFTLSYLYFEEFNDYTPMLDKEIHLKDFVHQFIFERSSISNGISLSEISESFGSYGKIAIENLIKNNLVEIINDRLVCLPQYQQHSWSTELYKQFASNVISNFYKTHSSINYLYCLNEGVSTTGYSKIMDILEAASQQITKVSQENPGNIPFSTVCFLDTLTNKELFGDKKEVL